MRAAIVALLPLLIACGDDSGGSSPNQVSGAALASDTVTMRSAEETYRDGVRAWNEGDRGAYFAVYADTLTCWYNEAGLARAAIEGGPRGARFRTGSSATMIVDSLTIVRGDDSEVMLVDEGRVLSQGSERAHRKLIVMRRVGGAWRIVVEVSPSRHSCWHDLPAGFGALSANPVSAARPARPARRAPARGSCRVTRIEAGCEDSAGTPPCRAVRTPDDAPPVRPGADRREALTALAEYAEGVNCELSPSFGPTGRISRLDGHCMGVGGTSWVYEGCD